MIEYTHRDRRAQREVSRAFFTMVGATVALIGFALAVPAEFAGFLAVAALIVLGIAYMGWSDRLLQGYIEDLRSQFDGRGPRGVLRAELKSPVGLDRDVGRRTARSPHSRRRAPEGSDAAEDSTLEAHPGSGQL